MSIDHDITAHLDTPNLSAVKVVAAIRQIAVRDARIALLTEWDQRLAAAIDAENNQAEMWAKMAADVAPTDLPVDRRGDRGKAPGQCLPGRVRFTTQSRRKSHV